MYELNNKNEIKSYRPRKRGPRTRWGLLAFLLVAAYITAQWATHADPETIETIVFKETARTVQAEITAYNSLPEQTDDTPFITASGKHTGPGVAACPAYLEFGTQVEIYGHTYICEDRMAKKYRDGNYFDIWMEHKEDAINFGRQQTTVTIY